MKCTAVVFCLVSLQLTGCVCMERSELNSSSTNREATTGFRDGFFATNSESALDRLNTTIDSSPSDPTNRRIDIDSTPLVTSESTDRGNITMVSTSPMTSKLTNRRNNTIDFTSPMTSKLTNRRNITMVSTSPMTSKLTNRGNITMVSTSPMTSKLTNRRNNTIDFTSPVTSEPTDRLNATMNSTSLVTSEAMDDADTDSAELTALERSLMLTREQRDLAIEILTYIFYVAVILVVPLLIFNIIVFLRPSMRSGTSAYVIGLSLAQLYYVVSMAGEHIFRAAVDDLSTSQMYLFYFGYVFVYGGISAKRGGYLLLCLVSVERLYAIVRPLHARTFFLSKRSLPVVCCALFLSFLWHVYLPCRNVVLPAGVNAKGQTVYRTFETELYRKTKDVNDAFSLAAKIVLSFATLLLQLLLNVLTICALRRHNMAAKRVQSSADDAARRHRERQMTVTILAATISYVILSLPSAVHNLCYTLFPYQYSSRGKYSNLYRVMNVLAGNLTTVGAGIDFVCFLKLCSAYRREFLKLFGCRASNPPRRMKESPTSLEQVEP